LFIRRHLQRGRKYLSRASFHVFEGIKVDGSSQLDDVTERIENDEYGGKAKPGA
jgi:hypothetical protein